MAFTLSNIVHTPPIDYLGKRFRLRVKLPTLKQSTRIQRHQSALMKVAVGRGDEISEEAAELAMISMVEAVAPNILEVELLTDEGAEPVLFDDGKRWNELAPARQVECIGEHHALLMNPALAALQDAEHVDEETMGK